MIFQSQYRTAVLLKLQLWYSIIVTLKKNACHFQPNDSWVWEHVINLTGSVEQSLCRLLK